MSAKLKLLLAGRSKDALVDLQNQLSPRSRLDVKLRHIENGHADPLYGLAEMPDLLILHIAGLEGGELDALLERPTAARPPMIVVSATGKPAVMRLAMQVGARDFLPQSAKKDILKAVDSVCDELTAQSSTDGELIAVVNAKGGAGATFLACNLAHLAVSATQQSAALIGLDMQFPALPSYFDLKPKHGLLQALESVDKMDAVALNAIMASHHSGLMLLAARPEDFRFSFENLAAQTSSLFDLLLSNYKHVVVDIPRRLDEVNAQVISRATRVVLVVQQSLPHIQDATRLRQLMRDQLGVPAERMFVVVNRYTKSAEISLADIEQALPGSEILLVPNQYKIVSESINLGVPMYEHARQSTITRALIELQARIIGMPFDTQPSYISSKLSSLLQKTPLQKYFGDH
jgi:pilus assembly protein CpaE